MSFERPAGALAPDPGLAPARTAGRRALLAACAAAPLLPFLAAGTFPSQDGPPHIETALLLDRIRAGTAPVVAAALQERDPGLSNGGALHALSWLLRQVDPLRAEWLLALGLTLLLLGAVLLAHRLLRGRPGDLAIGTLLCAPLMLYMGSFNLVLAIAGGLVAAAAAMRLLETGRARFGLLYLAAALPGCLANIQLAVPLLAGTFGGLAALALGRWRQGGRPWPARAEAMLAGFALPVIGLVLLYVVTMPGGELTAQATWAPRRQLAALLLRGDVAWFWWSDLVLLGLLNLAMLAAAAWWLRRGAADPAARWALAGAAALAVLTLVLPIDTGAVPQIPMRLAPFLQGLLFLWFLRAGLPAAWRRPILALALAAGMSLVVTRSLGHQALAGRIAEMRAAEAEIPDGSVLDVLRLSWVTSRPTAPHETPAHHLGGFRIRFSPFIHPGRVVGQRDILDLGNYQWLAKWRIFRLHTRPALAAVPGVGQLDWSLHEQQVPGGLAGHRARLRAATGRDIDYLLLWTGGLDPAALAARDPLAAEVLAELRAQFEPVFRSAPGGLAEVWRRKPE
ncbi:hypothetical protein [Paracraurococcus ruber]|uniref:hypothetical protein n=1 Tax=Paracraurococcus ruber TaxID=77675 RepID=UPI001057DA65|nr:hypothetical protein [Paracraurococcus ruber]TDG29885.1 hypothetical protein E2C05_16330 [Paracraurococcus ruber]